MWASLLKSLEKRLTSMSTHSALSRGQADPQFQLSDHKSGPSNDLTPCYLRLMQSRSPRQVSSLTAQGSSCRLENVSTKSRHGFCFVLLLLLFLFEGRIAQKESRENLLFGSYPRSFVWVSQALRSPSSALPGAEWKRQQPRLQSMPM